MASSVSEDDETKSISCICEALTFEEVLGDIEGNIKGLFDLLIQGGFFVAEKQYKF